MQNSDIFNRLIIFEMANNHMGSVEHGFRIVEEIYNVTRGINLRFGFKFQYRDFDTFIHPDYKNNYEYKYIKRFSETRLTKEQFKQLKDKVKSLGFVAICTPFDENSVSLIEKHDYDIIKIPSCSFTDWPLLERIAKSDKPIIASTAGTSLDSIDKVVSFFTHRNKKFALMHCVAEYPTKDSNLQLNQIDLLKSRYPQITVGYSTHEDPSNIDSVKIAIGKGAEILEKHVAVKTDKYTINAYSANPEQVKDWLNSAEKAYEMCGVSSQRMKFTEKETSSLRSLGRGIFVKRAIKKGDRITLSDVFMALPTQEGQIIANDMSKYTEIYAETDINSKQPVLLSQVKIYDNREKLYEFVQRIKEVIQKSGIFVPSRMDLEISHHYGVDKFLEYGCTLINFVNRDYCKKLIVVLPNQKHPEQFHKVKEETFHILYGNVKISLDGKEKLCCPGEIITIERGIKHIFSTETGTIIEEISSTHLKEDSFYTDSKILENKNRKTLITNWMG